MAIRDHVRRQPTLVRFSRKHIRYGLLLALFTSVFWTISAIAQDGFSTRTWISVGIYFALTVAGMIWANWRDDNSIERTWRAERRTLRVHAVRAKVR